MGTVEFSPSAEQDIDDIWLSLAVSNGIKTADRWTGRIVERCYQLADYPESGPARSDIAPHARSLTVSRWLILYQISSGGVRVNRIIDGARDFGQLDLSGTPQT